uniref:AB hydrolase-1 domain-containing protein n=1 Tax=Junco hyemalis TaxID=40217 RepID=A0A8C5IWI8_JUNHY
RFWDFSNRDFSGILTLFQPGIFWILGLFQLTFSRILGLEPSALWEGPECPFPFFLALCGIPGFFSRFSLLSQPGVRLHFVELGRGPALCLCHGFPESWLSWRFQMAPLARAGFRVIALEMKGYGDSSAPSGESRIINHGKKVWDKKFGGKIRKKNKLRQIPEFDYQLYFQEPGVAEAELEKDIGRTLKIMIRSSDPEVRSGFGVWGGLLVGLPEDPPESRLLPPALLQRYTRQFQKSGFRCEGPLNWYRNVRENQSWARSSGRFRKVPAPSGPVPAQIPRLQRGHIENCGHWTQMERPLELNRILLDWLENLPPENSWPGNSKL